MSQGDIEKRSGLLLRHVSRAENGQTVPAIETLEKMARAMEIRMPTLSRLTHGWLKTAVTFANSCPVGQPGILYRVLVGAANLISKMYDLRER